MRFFQSSIARHEEAKARDKERKRIERQKQQNKLHSELAQERLALSRIDKISEALSKKV